MGPGGPPRAGLGGAAPRLGAGPEPRDALVAGRAGAGGGRGGPAVASAVRGTSATYNRFGSDGRYGGSRYGYGHRAAYVAGAYAAGATAGYAYGDSSYGYSSDGDCYYVSRRNRRVTVCD